MGRLSWKALVAMGLGGSVSLFPGLSEVKAPAAWTGTATPQTDSQDPSVLGDGSWREQPVVGFDFSDYYPFDAPSYSGNPYSNVGTVKISHSDPSGKGLSYIGISLNDGPEVSLPITGARLSPRTGAFGYQFSLTSTQATYGNIKLRARVRPVNGREKVLTRIVFLDHQNVRPVRYLSTTGSNANDGTSPAKAFKDRAWAEANSPQGSRVIVSAGDYRLPDDTVVQGIVPGASTTTTIKPNVTNEMPIVLQADSGVSQDSILFGCAPQASGCRTGKQYWFNLRTRYRGVAMDWSNFSLLRMSGSVGTLKPALAWENTHNFEGTASNPRPLGPAYDPTNNNIADPDEIANPGCGGFGFYYDGTANYPDPSQPFYGSDGTWYSMENCTNQIISLRGTSTCLHFEQNCNGTHAFDAVYIGGGTSRGLTNPDGSPKLDTDDFDITNVLHYFPGRTPFKQRFHTTPTVTIASVQLIKDYTGSDTSRTITYSGKTYTGRLGFTLVTFANQPDGTVPFFNPRRSLNTDDCLRFVTSRVAGIYSTSATIAPTPATNSSDVDPYGWRILCASTQTADPTINGTAYPLGTNQAIICGDLTSGPQALQAGDVVCMFNKQHTDCFQTGQLAPGSPNFNNWTVQTYTAKGPGFGNMVLFQPVSNNNPQNGTASFDTNGLMTEVNVKTPNNGATTANTPFPLVVGDCITILDTGTYSAQKLQVAFVEVVNGDGTYRLNRPFISVNGDGTFTPIALTGATIQVNKSVTNVAFQNVQIACGNTGQIGGGTRNFQLLSSTWVSFAAGGGDPINTLLIRIIGQIGGYGGFCAVVLRDSLFYQSNRTVLSAVDISIAYGDPRRDAWITNCGMNAPANSSGVNGYPIGWSANDNGQTLVGLPNLAIDVDTFRVTGGMTGRYSGPGCVPFDGSGGIRIPGQSLIGSQLA